MANSNYEYVRDFEEATSPILLRECFLVVRIDGVSFHRFSSIYKFLKPNDKRCLDLMNTAAITVMKKCYPNIVLAYGQSDEFSFVFRKSCSMFGRRCNKLTSIIPSYFSSSFVRNWNHFFPDSPLEDDPAFDARCVLYPNVQVLLDYLRWRQVDCHINNLYNTTFHALTGQYSRMKLTQDGSCQVSELEEYQKPGYTPRTPREAQERLKDTFSKDKNEILFSEFGINYNNELEQFRKGSVIVLTEKDIGYVQSEIKKKPSDRKNQEKGIFRETLDPRNVETKTMHVDIIQEKFWEDNAYLLDYLNAKKLQIKN
jgi:tRNA(His) guanylyltransferase